MAACDRVPMLPSMASMAASVLLSVIVHRHLVLCTNVQLRLKAPHQGLNAGKRRRLMHDALVSCVVLYSLDSML